MRRLVIFSFYDEHGVVDAYIEYLLEDLKNCAEKIIIVINGEVLPEGMMRLRKYADEVIVRKNTGFDGSAYKEAIINYVTPEKLYDWDEVVFCNDTFFGPFLPFDSIFKVMEKSMADFWGLNRVEGKLFSHIQSYFMVFRKRIIEEEKLVEFLKNSINSESTSREEAFISFEVKLYKYLTKCGYRSDVFTNTENYDIYASPYRCIRDYQLPIMKKKCFSKEGQKDENVAVLQYLKENTGYDIRFILECSDRLFHYGLKLEDINAKRDVYITQSDIKAELPQVTKYDIEAFVRENQGVYIYGTGNLGKKIWYYFDKLQKNILGFVVSNNQIVDQDSMFGLPIQNYRNINKESAMIIAMNRKNSVAILPNIKPKDKVLFLWDACKRVDKEVNA